MMENDRLANLFAAYEGKKDDPFIRYAIALELKEVGELQRSKAFFLELHSDFPDYIPQYYHFGKLLEDLDELEKAKEIYVQGIQKSAAQNDQHALAEIQAALDLLEANIF